VLNRLLAFLIAVTLTLPAQAGPWLREKGTTFTAVSVTGTYYLDTGNQTYLEYGLSDKTTFIADIAMINLRNAGSGGAATLSLRRALSKPDAPTKWAYELGIGTGWVGNETLPHLRTALSWGRGVTLREKSGWMTAEASVIWDMTHQLHLTKFDATLGLNFTEVTSGMIQLYTAHIDGASTATLAPSFVFKPDFTQFQFQIGTESELGNARNSALKIGLWREF